ncbi:hypothetical protein BDF19DRAFT_313871 [Syncephalis fuscata]|nr:hypothetical protein BDF19DRAFT_313871 [Syncephalis fuscata]
MKMESSYSSSLEKDIADIPSSTLLVTPSLSYSHSDSSATTTNDYDDDDDHNSTDKLCHDHDYASSDIDGKVFQLSTSRSALSSVYPTSIEASSNILSSSLASIASNVSLSSSTSYIRSRRRAPATTLATSPVTKAIVIPSTTDAATYAAATMESLPKSASPLYSYDEDTHYSSLDTLNYDEFRFIITEFGVISHIRDRPTVEQRRFPLSSYTPSPTTPGGGLATLTRICASALGLGGDNTDDTTANTEAHSLLSASSVSSRVSAITLCSSKAIGQPIFRYVHNDDLPVLCRTLSRACARVSRCAIRWSSEIDQDHMTRRQSTLSKDTPINSADHKSGNHLATTSVNWRGYGLLFVNLMILWFVLCGDL